MSKSKKEFEEEVFDKFTDDLYSIIMNYVDALSVNLEEEEKGVIVDNIIRRVSKYYSKH